MNRLNKSLLWACSFLGLLLSSACGIIQYPGQPGVVTNNFSKIDMEDLEEEGLYVYETTYDNQKMGKGVAAIVTKLYPGAKTFTSNVRTNSDGTVYRTKAQYDGAVVEMISLPQVNQVMLPNNSTVQLFTSYKLSLNEVDDKNIAELGLFTQPKVDFFSSKNLKQKKNQLDLLRTGTLTRNGTLAYEVASVEFGSQKFTPTTPFQVETNFFQNSVRTNLNGDMRKELVEFVETNFPKGFDGQAKIQLKGNVVLPMEIGLHTAKTAEAAGVQVLRNVSRSQLQAAIQKINDLK